MFVNVYAPNSGAERIKVFLNCQSMLGKYDKNACLVLGGDWNCTLDSALDRNGEEPCPFSATGLNDVVSSFDLCDVWRSQHPVEKQYTWCKSSSDYISFARLDRFYINKDWCNRILKACIYPTGFSDHHLCMIVFNLQKTRGHSYYWHFNVKLLQDASFCEKFYLFWAKWRERKTDFDDVVHWWDVGKAHIRIFCQNYTANANCCFKKKLLWSWKMKSNQLKEV